MKNDTNWVSNWKKIKKSSYTMHSERKSLSGYVGLSGPMETMKPVNQSQSPVSTFWKRDRTRCAAAYGILRLRSTNCLRTRNPSAGMSWRLWPDTTRTISWTQGMRISKQKKDSPTKLWMTFCWDPGAQPARTRGPPRVPRRADTMAVGWRISRSSLSLPPHSTEQETGFKQRINYW